MSTRQIFNDPSGRRWRFSRAFGLLVALFAAVVIGVLVWGAATSPFLPQPPLKRQQPVLHAGKAPVALREPKRAAVRDGAFADALRYGFFVNWDDNSFVSLKRNATKLDVLAPEWLHLKSAQGDIVVDDAAKEKRTRTWLAANAPHLAITPLINNFDSATQAWNANMVRDLVADPASRAAFVAAIDAKLAEHGDHGLHLDFEQVPKASMTAYVMLVQELAARLHASGRVLDVSVPADDESYPFAQLAAAADHLFLMAYDEHTDGGDPGPVASQGWFEATLDKRFKEIPSNKLVVGIANYGYDWTGSGHADEITVQQAWQTARESSADISFDPDALNPAFSYDEEDGKHHQVWFVDAAAGFNQAAAALTHKPAGLALWRMGSEDPSLWAWFAEDRGPDARAVIEMQTMEAGYDLVYDGDGEALQVTGTAKSGARIFERDLDSALITHQKIEKYPEPVMLSRWGKADPHKIALTFDDGPDPIWTPKILDVLKSLNAPATFFIIGRQAVAEPALLQRILAEGHDIGTHTFTHPNIGELPDAEARVELNETERAIDAITGVRPLLFRPPYAEDVEPETVDDARIVELASKLGYITLGLRVDPSDWARPGVQAIVDATVDQVENDHGQVILLHDSGGDRSQTLAALPLIVERLRKDGYTFVTTHELLGLSRAALMPPAPKSISTGLEGMAFWTLHHLGALMGVLFVGGLTLGFIRFFAIGGLALVQAFRPQPLSAEGPVPAMSVIVPAYNEAKVIVGAVRSILAAAPANERFEIVVVDDGSSDGTADLARAAFKDDPRVRVLSKVNGGKASAINAALEVAANEVVLVVDADTHLAAGAIDLLARRFGDPEIGAVAGNAKVGNRINILTRFQAVEYITSQNLDRRAFEVLDAIAVVPGAIGAWRKSALQAVGGFSSDTLAEDADATIMLQRAGWRVRYEPAAIARTEAPERLKPFLKQRFRWMFGTLQAAFKHRDAAAKPGRRRLGLTLQINIVVFQILFPLISPVMDALLVWNLISAAFHVAMHPAEPAPAGMWLALGFYLAFQTVELAGAALAFALEKDEDWRLLPLVVVQRFCYRQWLYWTAIRAFLAALRGGVVGWGKLARSGRLDRPLAADKHPKATTAHMMGRAPRPDLKQPH